ncbi:MAG: shikimate kinase [Oscillospiraceae bacterium]|nr:shikimate kinase [Oscillospiraceae bacterium]
MDKKFGLLGETLAHSFSPQIHARMADYEYKLYEKSPNEVRDFLLQGDFDGLNVTIPYKKTVIPFCETLSENAVKIGSVNTMIKNADGTLHGDNTDYFGFLYMLRKSGVDVFGKKALILGNGGAALTVRAVLEDSGAGEIVTVSRTGVDNYENIDRHKNAWIIVNTTPVGMYPDNGVSPVALDIFDACETVLDIVYNPAKTELMLEAEDRGIAVAGGLYMLTAQAKRAAELFLDINIPDQAIDSITADIERQTKNIVLIGMPGCGKSSVGKKLAELTGREFHDTDELIVTKAGKSIERIFAEDGEDIFRDIEQDVLKVVSGKSGCVIATGGGIVKRAINRRFLRQNSVTVFLDREIDQLPLDGRPLSQAHGITTLYNERLPLYTAWSDYSVRCGEGVHKTALAVQEALLL